MDAPSKVVVARRCAAGLVALALCLSTWGAGAAELPIFLGAIGVGPAKPEVRSELRSLLRAELASPEFSRLKTSEHYVLAASVVRLDSVPEAGAVRATCVVSLAILRRDSTLYALINGRATARQAVPGAGEEGKEGQEAERKVARSDALRAAVHSAMVRVPKALR